MVIPDRNYGAWSHFFSFFLVVSFFFSFSVFCFYSLKEVPGCTGLQRPLIQSLEVLIRFSFIGFSFVYFIFVLGVKLYGTSVYVALAAAHLLTEDYVVI